MRAHKRGLGRGLEVLLADTPHTGTAAPRAASHDSNAQADSLAQAGLRTQHQLLMQEAEDLKNLLDELTDLLGPASH